MIYGVGIYDGLKGKANNKNKMYQLWSSMLKRCYSEKFLENHPSYIETLVCDEWKYYSKFEEWAKEHYIDNYQLDKDLISGDRKIYSPDTCSFVPKELNTCILESNSNTEYPIGVYYQQKAKNRPNELLNPYRARIVKYGIVHNLGYYKTPEEAHKEWQIAKISYFNELIYFYTGKVHKKVLDGLQRRIVMLQNDIDNERITKTVNKV